MKNDACCFPRSFASLLAFAMASSAVLAADVTMRPDGEVRTISAAGLLNAAMLVFRVLNPQVLHADIAWVAESNQPIPVSFRAKRVTSVRQR